MDNIEISGRMIGPNHLPLVIAEIGINHSGDLKLAKQMVLLAAKSGCECVKHQTHIVSDEMTNEAKNIFPPNDSRSIWEVIDDCSLTLDEERELKAYAESLGLIYISTPFSRAAADFLDELDVPAFKIGSGEIDNLPLLRHIASKGRPVIASTGMQTIKTLDKSVKILRDANIPFVLLECTNLYPSPPEIVSLRGIEELKNAFPGIGIGFSDHSVGPSMALAAVALGAIIIERHFTDTRYRAGPDIACSMDPAELRFLIDRSKEIFIARRNPKMRADAEQAVYDFARSSIVADIDLPAGHVIKPENIWARRPGNGQIAGFEFDKVVGRKLLKSVVKNQQLTWSDFE